MVATCLEGTEVVSEETKKLDRADRSSYVPILVIVDDINAAPTTDIHA